MNNCRAFLLCALVLFPAASRAQFPPDPRMKADILLIVAHPDDETAIGSYLAKAVFDDGKRVAIIYCNRGTGGGNSAGTEQAGALGDIREIEARRAVASFGITNVWFLNGRDTPGQDLFQSLQAWRHGAVLEDVVRLVRLTRPEVIVTWLPGFVAGENHGDHQASAVIAVEAFDCAGDPTVFPAQVTPPRERGDIANATEGLRAWQPKKIYFFSDASHEITAEGPAFDIREVSPSRKQPYYKIALALHTPHLTQADVSQPALEAEKTGDYAPIVAWLGKMHLIFGKSVVPARAQGDVFEGTGGGPVPWTRPAGYSPDARSGVSVDLGGPFAFYRDFWRAHGIERLAGIVPPEIEVAAGSYLFVPLLIRNGTADSVTVSLTSVLPASWSEASGSGSYRIAPGETLPVQTFVRAGSAKTAAAVPVTWKGAVQGRGALEVTLRATLVDWALPW